MDPRGLIRTLEEIKRLSRDPLAADRIEHIVDRLKRDLEDEIAREAGKPAEESGAGPGLVQPPKDN